MRSVLAGFLILVSSTAIALGRPALRHNSDSLIPVFVSLDSWTPFFWGQDRFGMPIALIAAPVVDGFANLVVQNVVSVLLLLMGIYGMGVSLRHRCPEIPPLIVGLALLVWPTPSVQMLTLTTNQSYAPALGLAGLAIASQPSRNAPWRVCQSLLLWILVAWLNAGVALLLLCVGGLAVTVHRARLQSTTWMMAGAVVGLVVHRGLQTLATDLIDTTHFTVVSADRFLPTLATFWADAAREIFGLAGLTLAAILAWAWWRGTDTRRALIAATMTGGLLYGSTMAVALHGLTRHATPILLLPLTLAALALSEHLAHWWRRAGMVVMAVAILIAAQPRSPAELRRALWRDFHPHEVAAGLRANAAAVTGDYWSVWPVVFSMRYLAPMSAVDTLPVVLRAERLLRDRGGQDLMPGRRVLIIPASDSKVLGGGGFAAAQSSRAGVR